MTGLLTFCASAALLVAAAAVSAQTSPPAELKPGDPAPAFTRPGSDGKTYSLAEFKGKKPVVLAWYPKAFTGG